MAAADRTLASTATGAAPFVEEALRWLPNDTAASRVELEIEQAPIGVARPAVEDVRRRVLVADDNADMRQYIAQLLTPRYEVTAVADGEAALASIAEARPDVVLSDIMMPRLDDLVDVSRITRGRLTLQTEACDLGEIARRIAEDYRSTLEGTRLSLEIAAPARPVWVEGDPLRLGQMIGNLLQNAGRFTDAGGRVTVTVEAGADGFAAVRVADTWIGIDPPLLPRLFDPFVQGDQGLARQQGGLGLGLALTKGLAELHGGTLAADSRGRGTGSTFTLRVPLGRAGHQAAHPAEAAPPPGRRLRILVVEDNRDAAESLGDLLALGGHEVEIAADGAQGLAAARRRSPDVVISDLGLPGGLDGYALARALKADPTLAHIRIIALSGYANEESRLRSLEAGFHAHLAKPPDLRALEQALGVTTRR